MSMPRSRQALLTFAGLWLACSGVAGLLPGCGEPPAQPTLSSTPAGVSHTDVAQTVDAAIVPPDGPVADAAPAGPDAPAVPDAPPAVADAAPTPDDAAPGVTDVLQVDEVAAVPDPGSLPDQAGIMDITPDIAIETVPDVVVAPDFGPEAAADVPPELPIPPPGGHAVCDPCASSAVCSGLGAGAACVGLGKPAGATGFFCAVACSAQGCPAGYTCSPTSSAEGSSGSWCLPTTAPCTCSAAAVAAKWTTSCFKPLFDSDGGVVGQCGGVWSCTASGDPCSAVLPGNEICDGVDNDCDGLTDEQTGTALCDDGDACTTGDACVAGKCVAGKYTCGCQSDAECQPGANPCLGIAFCDKSAKPAVCGYKAGSAVVCPAPVSPACAANTCDAATGKCQISAKNEGGACDADGSACTASDQCKAGSCVVGAVLVCNDANPCTDDSCDPKTGCVHKANALPCDADGNACTVGDHCVAGSCFAGNATVCSGSLCMSQKCNPADGLCVDDQAAADGTICSASTPCAGPGQCKAGACAPGAPPDCGDANPCTDDACQPGIGCVHTPNAAACNDGNPCTAADVCSAGACKPGAMICECQVDADCAPKNPTNLCEGTLICDAGKGHICVIKPETVVKCAPVGDGVCEHSACEPTTGACVTLVAEKGKPCDDGNACTIADACSVGLCQPGGVVTCDDKNPCTVDACDPVSGACSHAAIPGCGVTFQKRYGGPGVENFYGVAHAADGGFVAAGYTDSSGAGARDGLLVKVDACGNLVWQQTYGGAKDEELWGVATTQDGGYIACGSSDTFSGSFVVRTDSQGKMVWQGRYGAGGFDYARKVLALKDGGFLLLVEQYSFSTDVGKVHKGAATKLDKDGEVVWSHAYGGVAMPDGATAEGDAFFRAWELNDGNIMIGGSWETTGYGDDDYTFTKLNGTDGTVQWVRVYGTDSDDEISNMEQTSDGGWVITGHSAAWGSIYHTKDIQVTKIAPDWTVQWSRRFGGFDDDRGYAVFEVPDGYVAMGRTSSFGVSKDIGAKWTGTGANPNVQYDAFFAKLDKAGKLVDFKIYGNAYTQYGFAAARDGVGGFLIAGQEFGFGAGKSDGFLVKIDGNGNSGDCDTTDVPLSSISQATGTLKTKMFKPYDFGAAFKLPSKALQYGSELTESAICPCK